MAGSIHHLSREHIVYSFDKSHPPALEIDSGDIVEFETWDARTGTILRDEDSLEQMHPDGANPATGPILVKGAKPGDGLCVEILGIELADQGFLGVKKGMGLLGHMATRFETKVVSVRDGQVYFDERIQFPVNPMVGVISTTPAGEGVATGMPSPAGSERPGRPGSYPVRLPATSPDPCRSARRRRERLPVPRAP